MLCLQQVEDLGGAAPHHLGYGVRVEDEWADLTPPDPAGLASAAIADTRSLIRPVSLAFSKSAPSVEVRWLERGN